MLLIVVEVFICSTHLKIKVGNLQRVEILNAIKYLFEKFCGFLLCERFFFSQEVEELPTCNTWRAEAELLTSLLQAAGSFLYSCPQTLKSLETDPDALNVPNIRKKD